MSTESLTLTESHRLYMSSQPSLLHTLFCAGCLVTTETSLIIVKTVFNVPCRDMRKQSAYSGITDSPMILLLAIPTSRPRLCIFSAIEFTSYSTKVVISILENSLGCLIGIVSFSGSSLQRSSTVPQRPANGVLPF